MGIIEPKADGSWGGRWERRNFKSQHEFSFYQGNFSMGHRTQEIPHFGFCLMVKR